METKERKRLYSKSLNTMTDKEFQKLQDFKVNGNKYLEENGKEEYMTIGSTNFLAFLNMLQVLGDRVAHISDSKPFRIVIDYDPEQVKVVIHKYITDKSGLESFQVEKE
ncbi:MAG: hypothetical protein J6C19_02375 [Lachnospiraceae bacterium]|nr:hypothetical protein [Lachnospiraceae bacterium]MBO5144365.1 hypothetical protein [Lachnospiraceae bacterium]